MKIFILFFIFPMLAFAKLSGEVPIPLGWKSGEVMECAVNLFNKHYKTKFTVLDTTRRPEEQLENLSKRIKNNINKSSLKFFPYGSRNSIEYIKLLKKNKVSKETDFIGSVFATSIPYGNYRVLPIFVKAKDYLYNSYKLLRAHYPKPGKVHFVRNGKDIYFKEVYESVKKSIPSSLLGETLKVSGDADRVKAINGLKKIMGDGDYLYIIDSSPLLYSKFKNDNFFNKTPKVFTYWVENKGICFGKKPSFKNSLLSTFYIPCISHSSTKKFCNFNREFNKFCSSDIEFHSAYLYSGLQVAYSKIASRKTEEETILGKLKTKAPFTRLLPYYVLSKDEKVIIYSPKVVNNSCSKRYTLNIEKY